MLVPRVPVLSVLLLLLLVLLMAAERCHAASRQRGSAPRAEGRLMGPGGGSGTGKGPKRTGRSNHDGNLRDPKHKEKFITHLTGPLYFKPQCRRQFHRLYHTTRDCTVPAYYKRCARLLTQLARSPRCAER